jgi:hypothetical protein
MVLCKDVTTKIEVFFFWQQTNTGVELIAIIILTAFSLHEDFCS